MAREQTSMMAGEFADGVGRWCWRRVPVRAAWSRRRRPGRRLLRRRRRPTRWEPPEDADGSGRKVAEPVTAQRTPPEGASPGSATPGPAELCCGARRAARFLATPGSLTRSAGVAVSETACSDGSGRRVAVAAGGVAVAGGTGEDGRLPNPPPAARVRATARTRWASHPYATGRTQSMTRWASPVGRSGWCVPSVVGTCAANGASVTAVTNHGTPSDSRPTRCAGGANYRIYGDPLVRTTPARYVYSPLADATKRQV